MSSLNPGSKSGKWSKVFEKSGGHPLGVWIRKRDPPLGVWRFFRHFPLSSNTGLLGHRGFIANLHMDWNSPILRFPMAQFLWFPMAQFCDSIFFVHLVPNPNPDKSMGIFRCWLTSNFNSTPVKGHMFELDVRCLAAMEAASKSGALSFRGPNLGPLGSHWFPSKFYRLGGLNIMSIEAVKLKISEIQGTLVSFLKQFK